MSTDNKKQECQNLKESIIVLVDNNPNDQILGSKIRSLVRILKETEININLEKNTKPPL